MINEPGTIFNEHNSPTPMLKPGSGNTLVIPSSSLSSVPSVPSVSSVASVAIPVVARSSSSSVAIPVVARSSSSSVAKHRRGFTLIEIMFAIAILGVGLIMVAATFPIAIKWTTEDAQKTIGQTIAQSAVAYLYNNFGAGTIDAPPGTTAWIPLATLPLPAYELKSAIPYAQTVINPSTPYVSNPYALYSWTAVIREDPITFANPSTVPTWDVYIFVFNKGDINNIYGGSSPLPTLSPGTIGGGSIPIDTIGVDITSGQVVREIVDPTSGKYTAIGLTSGQISGDSIVYAPPATGQITGGTTSSNPQTASPTVYVYATTMKF